MTTPAKKTGDLAQITANIGGSQVVVIGLTDWSLKWKRKTIPSTTTDSSGYAGNLASTPDWTATAKFAYIDGDVPQSAVRAAIATLQTSSQPYTFGNVSDGDIWAGSGFMSGIDLDTGVGKLLGMDITIEGDGGLQNTGGILTGLLFQDTVTSAFRFLSFANGGMSVADALGGTALPAVLIDTVTGLHYALTLTNNNIVPVLVDSSIAGVASITIADSVTTGARFTLTVTNAAFYVTAS